MENDKPLICIVDDDRHHNEAMSKTLLAHEFRTITFSSASEFLSQKDGLGDLDLVISDINMPGASGFDLCRALRAEPSAVRLPIILITGSDPHVDRAHGLEAGADDFIGKPFAARHLVAKIRSLLEIRAREVKSVRELRDSKVLNAELGRFLSPNIAHRLAQTDHQDLLQPHRAEVTVLFVDLRGFTAFSEKVEPEEVLGVLREYYTAVGTAAIKYKGTLGHLAGDGIMIFFNDPEPVKDHRETAIRMALDARKELMVQKQIWDERHYAIDFGIGLSEGFATIGGIGFDRFSQYSVIGSVTNFASRLCNLAVGGQILLSHRFLSRLEPGAFHASPVGELTLKGIEKPVSVYNILSVAQALRVAA